MREGSHRPSLRAAAHPASSADGACRSRQLDDQQARGLSALRPRCPQDAQPAVHLDRQPLLRGALQDAEVPARLSRQVRLDRARRAFCREFFSWYNGVHRHSAIGLMTPDAVHHGRAADPRPPVSGSRGRLRRDPRTLRQTATAAARTADRCLDQQARRRTGCCTLNSRRHRLIRLDRLRLSRARCRCATPTAALRASC